MNFIKPEKNYDAPFVNVQIKYELAIKKYGDGCAETEYYPIMSDGTAVVQKVAIQDIAVLGSNYGTIDKFGCEKIPCIYDSCEPINEKYYIVGKNYTDGGMSGDDYSFPKQKYGIVDSYGKEVIPLTMKYIINSSNHVSIIGFKDEYYIGLISQNGTLDFYEGLDFRFNDSLEYRYKSITGTNKVTIIGKGFILKDGDYNNYQEFINAYHAYINYVNEKTRLQYETNSSNIESPRKNI